MMEKEHDFGQDTGELLIYVVAQFSWISWVLITHKFTFSRNHEIWSIFIMKMKPIQVSTNL